MKKYHVVAKTEVRNNININTELLVVHGEMGDVIREYTSHLKSCYTEEEAYKALVKYNMYFTYYNKNIGYKSIGKTDIKDHVILQRVYGHNGPEGQLYYGPFNSEEEAEDFLINY